MDWQVALDGLRVVVGSAAFILAVLVFRNGIVQGREDRRSAPHSPERLMPHPATYAAYSLSLVTLSLIRYEHLGQPWHWDILLNVVAVVFATWGLIERERRHRTVLTYRRDSDD